jgi:asparagine synthetase B (glutamine-hydrolysing)
MLNEFYIREKKIISIEEWEQRILAIKQSVKEDLQDHKQAKEDLTKQIVRAVQERIPEGTGKLGVLFSGGVDSSLIALILKNAGQEFTCYTLGFKAEDTKEPEDVEAACQAAEKIGVKLKTIILDLEEAETLIKKTVKIMGKELNNVINIGVGGVVLGCIEMAKHDGVKFFFSGLGSEEIFAGYQRHRLSKDRQEECWQGLINMYERDLLRDSTLVSSSNVAFLTPFLDEKLMAVAMRVPDKFKMNEQHSKLILRQVAEELGLPKEVAWRAKRAAQYGSRLDKAISKLARQKGFKLKKDYLRSLE